MRHAVAAAAVLIATAACTGPIPVQHGLDERQANEIQSTLVDHGLEPEKVLEPGKKPTWSVQVPREQSAAALRVLRELELPRPRAAGLSDVFGAQSLMPTPAEESARLLMARTGELVQTLESVNGVVSARVHLVLPPPPRPGAAPVPAKASAFLKVRPGAAELVKAMTEELRALVAGGVEHLSADQVTLVVSEVAAIPPARPLPPSHVGVPALRAAVVALGGTVTLLSLALVWLALRLRRERTRTDEALKRPQAIPARAATPAATAVSPPPRKVA